MNGSRSISARLFLIAGALAAVTLASGDAGAVVAGARSPACEPPARAINRHPGGKDALGAKEDVLVPYYAQMVEVSRELAGRFAPLGLHLRPEILLATAMQEASATEPLTARSFDNGLGLMQITPYNGDLDGDVARSIGWNNARGLDYNIQHSKWRNAKANLTAGAYVMLSKAHAIAGALPTTWKKMNETHRWRAVLYAYNAGQGSAIDALRRHGPSAAMISTYTVNGRQVSHDYTREIEACTGSA